MNELLTMFTFEKLYNLTINMLSQREIRFQKRKIEEVFFKMFTIE